MKKTKIKYLSTATLACLVLTTTFGNVYAGNNKIASSTYSNTALEKTLQNYENNLKEKKSSFSLRSVNNSSSSNYSDSDKQDILEKTFKSYDKKEFASSSSKEYKTLLNSMKDDTTSSYKFFIESTKTLSEVKEVFNYFDDVEVTLISDASEKNIYKVLIPYSGKISKAISAYIVSGTLPSELFSDIELIQPFVVESTIDSDYLAGESSTSNWGIEKIGAQDYQKYLSTKDKIKVGVIDTGIYYDHADLSSNIYVNSGEVAGNGLDDDGNGYIDDVNGFDFIAGDSTAEDDYGHGTHVAGIIGATVNGSGIYGVNSNVDLVSLKVLDSNGSGSSYSIIEALQYAADNGINIVNLSLGGAGTPSTDSMCSMISQVKSKGVITIVAAGNSNVDTSGYIPAGCSDAITVGAVDSSLTKASFSNYGDEVDVAAPGVNIYSTVMSGGYQSWNGTSMATPFVTGLVASMKATDSSLTYDEIKSSLINNGVEVTSSQNIGKFISMSNVMTSLGVTADETKAENVLPEVSLTVTDKGENIYNVLVEASDSDGEILNVVGYLNGEVYGSGTSYDVTVSADSTFKVIVTDNDGGQSEASTTLTYTEPETSNVLPEVSLEVTDKGENIYNVLVEASDSDGEISSVVGYLNGEVYGSGTSYEVTVSVDSTFKAIVTDNDGGQSEASTTLSYTAPETPNVLPEVSLEVTDKGENIYNVLVEASDSDGEITNVVGYLNQEVYGSGTSYEVTVSVDSTFKVIVTDNDGGQAEASATLSYTAPETPNVLPEVSLTVTEKGENIYNVLVEAIDSDGEILNVVGYLNGEVYGSGTSYDVTVSADSTFKAIVTDNDGGQSEASTTLSYTAPETPNVLPEVSLEVTDKGENIYNVLVEASDSDGEITNVVGYLNQEVYGSGTSYEVTVSADSTFKVIVTDNDGGQAEASATLSYTAPETDITSNLSVTASVIKDNYYKVIIDFEDKSNLKEVRTYYSDYRYTRKTSFSLKIKSDLTLKTIAYYKDGTTEEVNTLLEYSKIAPTVDLYTKEISKNKYLIYPRYKDSDGWVKSINIYSNGELISNKKYFYLDITKDTLVKVEVIDNDGLSATDEETLVFDDSANQAPELDLKSMKLLNRTYLSIKGIDTDGKIVKMDLYLNGELYKTYKVNNSIYYKTLRFGKSGYNVKVILTDDSGNTTEKSIDL